MKLITRRTAIITGATALAEYRSLGQILTGNYRKVTAWPPLSAWPMNEGSGLTLHDVSGNSNTATISSAGEVTWQSNAGFPGITPLWNNNGNAVASSATLTNFDGTTPFSVGLWVSSTTTTQPAAYLSSLNATGGTFQGWEVSRDSSGQVVFFLVNNYPSNAIQVNGPPSVNNASLHYIVVTYDGSRSGATGVKIYVDGVSQTLTVAINSLSATSASGIPVAMAARQDFTTKYTGVMAFVKIVPFVWTGPQVATNFGKGPAIY